MRDFYLKGYMTKDEALKLALDALERCVATCFDPYAHEQAMSWSEHFVNQTITAIKEALAQPEQEPVAWAKFSAKGNIIDLLSEPDDDYTPLYTTPPQCTKQEPVAWIKSKELLVMKGNAYAGAKNWRVNLGLEPEEGDVPLYTEQPQRTWVGLTNEETIEIELGLRIPTGYRDAYDLSLHDFVKTIEAKLKEKNK